MSRIEKIPSTVKNIGQNTFRGLMKDLKCETGDDIEAVGFKSSRGPFQISFHGNLEDNYQVSIEDFGMNLQGGGWEILEPTEAQVQTMQNKLLEMVEELQEKQSTIVEFQDNHGIYSQYY